MSRFNRRAKLDTGQVQDRRGKSGGAIAGGVGGGVGLIILIITLLMGGNPLDGGDGGVTTNPGVQQDPSGQTSIDEECQTGEDANERQDCRVVAYVNSIQEYWTGEFDRRGQEYQQSTTHLFNDSTQSGCGFASSQTGPFYCPADMGIYVDLDFFEVLSTRLGAEGGPFAEGYVLAHEYGHHIQNLTGVLRQASNRDSGPDSDAVAIELQADCYAGVWAHHAEGTEILETLSDEDIRIGLDTAAAVGDDTIQERTQGEIHPESWTHGSSEQRQQWFLTGYETGDPGACDTFAD